MTTTINIDTKVKEFYEKYIAKRKNAFIYIKHNYNLYDLLKEFLYISTATIPACSREILGKRNDKEANKDDFIEKIHRKVYEYFENKSLNLDDLFQNLNNDLFIKKVCYLKYLHFGIVQKMVNISFKYLLVFYYLNEAGYQESDKNLKIVFKIIKEYEDKFVHKLKEFHCPVDGIILKELSKKFKDKLKKENIDIIVKTKIVQIRFGKNEKKPWSKLTYEEYVKMQNFIIKNNNVENEGKIHMGKGLLFDLANWNN